MKDEGRQKSQPLSPKMKEEKYPQPLPSTRRMAAGILAHLPPSSSAFILRPSSFIL
jgi:hypothetical protein